ncbi:acetate kinase [Streptococcus devriesei]|uniref:acetate kinase n=1 Tax=Streptococcus devriesei TaxID=231233 RepID=UPI00040975EF|nr:acetate kinase [Streptococcus devriesei]
MIDNICDLIKYHDGQIASRSLSRKLTVDTPVTLYAMAKGESISNESGKLTKLIQVLEGSLQVETADERYLLEAQGMLSIAADQVHNLYALEDSKILQIEL